MSLPLPGTESQSAESLTISGADYLSIPKGSTNGLRGGLRVILDAEVFDSAYIAKHRCLCFKKLFFFVTDAQDKKLERLSLS